MQPNNFTNLFFKKYAVKIRESHNFSFEHALLKPDIDKQKDVTKIVTGLGLPSSIKTMYDYRIHFDVDYDRLYQFCVINLCTEIEYFFKELYNFFSLTKPATEKGNFFQRFRSVIKDLEGNHSVNFDSVRIEIDDVALAFQIRHLCIHNMGIVDSDFHSKTAGRGVLNQYYRVSQSEYVSMFNALGKIMIEINKRFP